MYGAVHDTTVPGELKNAQYAGLLDPGRYKVSVKMSNKAKECITSMRIFGNEEDLTEDCYTDDGCTRVLHPVTEPKIEFQFSSDPECMRDMSVYITIVPVTTDGAELDDKMAFQIGLRPLAVSFDKLVAALTCLNFDLGNLQKDIAWGVLRAAVGTNPQEICSVDKNLFEESDGYTWAVAPNQTALTYVAKKGKEEAFRIIFPVDNDGKSKPVVWVKDADSYQSKDKITDLADSIIKQRQYANYCINFNGRDYYENCEA